MNRKIREDLLNNKINIESLNFLEKKLHFARVADNVPFLEGEKGIGKTTIVKQYAKKMNMDCIVLDFASVDRVYLMGLMDIITYKKSNGDSNMDKLLEKMNLNEYSYHKNTIPNWIIQIFKNDLNGIETLLFLDELPRATSDVLNGLLNLILERKYGVDGIQLPKTTFIVGSGNPNNDDYIVTTLDFALKGRLIKMKIKEDIEEWQIWAQENNIHEKVISFLSINPKYLLQNGNIDQNNGELTTGTDPRRWEMFSNQLKVEEFFKIKNDIFKETCIEILGIEIGLRFFEYYLDDNIYNYKIFLKDIEKILNEEKTLNSQNIEKVLNKFEKDFDAIQQIQKNEIFENILENFEKNKQETKYKEEIIYVISYLVGLEKTLSIYESQNKKYTKYKKIIEKYSEELKHTNFSILKKISETLISLI